MANAKNTEPAAAGHNLTEITKAVQDAAKRIRKLKGDRDAIGEDIKAVRKEVKALGVPLKAFNYAMKIADLDRENRNEYDTFVAMCRDALGIPAQGDLFETAESESP